MKRKWIFITFLLGFCLLKHANSSDTNGIYTLKFTSISLTSQSQFIYIKIGKPDKDAFALLDYYTSNVIVADSECGTQIECKKYCENDQFNKIFCLPLCNKLNKVERLYYCPYLLAPDKGAIQLNPYDSNQSSTYRNTTQKPFDVEWKTRYNNVNPTKLYGLFGEEDFQFFSVTNYINRKFNSTFMFEANEIRFVRALMIDPYAFSLSNITIGLLPSPDNLFVQLYNKGIIQKPLISFWGKQKFIDNDRVTIGAFDLEICKNWKTFSFDERWTLKAQKVYFNDGLSHRLMIENVDINIDPNIGFGGGTKAYNLGITLSDDLKQQLLNSKILFKAPPDLKDYLLYSIDAHLTMSLQVEGKLFSLDKFVMFNDCYNSTHTRTMFQTFGSPSRRYNPQKRSIVLGNWFFQISCYGIDFMGSKFALANRNNYPPNYDPNDNCKKDMIRNI